jgi:hypothetical protein
MHESPSGTILKKDLEIQGLFFRLQESGLAVTSANPTSGRRLLWRGDLSPLG